MKNNLILPFSRHEYENTMKPEPLKSGDVVIELVGLAKTNGIVAGGIASAVSAWIGTHSYLYAGIAFVVGCILGYFLAIPIGKWLFPSRQGKVAVARHGMPSLPRTMRASIPSALAASFVCSVSIGILSKSPQLGIILIAAVIIGVVMGTILACLSSLA